MKSKVTVKSPGVKNNCRPSMQGAVKSYAQICLQVGIVIIVSRR